MKVKLKTPVRHDKKKYSTGDIVAMSEAQAKRLVSFGVAEICDDLAEDNDGDKTGDGDPGRQDKDPRNPELMTMDELKQELSLLGIAYNSRTSKGQLLKLYLGAKGNTE